jgi:putative ABC transport system permease protein
MIHYLRALAARLRGLLGDQKADRELDDEIEAHLRLLTERYVRQGMTAAEAVWAARRQFGNVTLLQEANRETRRSRVIDTLVQDLRYGARMLRKNPGFTMTAVITLALGIGANTAIFSAVNALLFRTLPVEGIDRLVFGFSLREGFDPFGTSLLEYAAYRERGYVFAQSGVGRQQFFNLIGRNEPERLQGAAVMAEFLNTLGVKPIFGRSFTTEEDRPGGPAVAILGYGLWRRRFGGDGRVIGAHLNLDGRDATVVGVMPPGFDMPLSAEIWTPLQIDIRSLPLEAQARHDHEMVARLEQDVSVERADAELKAVARSLEEEHPQFARGWSYGVVPLRQQLIGDLAGRTRKSLFALLAAVAFILLICCANVANLLLARGVSREREMAIRWALGASRGRIVRQLLTESVLLASLGGMTGLLLAYWLVPFLGALSPIQAVSLSAFLNDIRIDARVLAFTLFASALTGALFGLAPALRAAVAGRSMTLIRQGEQRTGGVAGRRLRGALVVGQIAVAVTLLIGGALMAQSFRRLQQVELGFRPEKLLTMQMALSSAKYQEHRQRVAFIERVLEQVEGLPGVVSAGITTNIPLAYSSVDSIFTVEGRPPANPGEVAITASRLVSPGYLETLGVTLVKGRLITEQDRAGGAPVVVISEELARQAWPGEDPIGKRVRAGRFDQTDRPWLTVVGIVKDVKEDRFNFRIHRPVWYIPYFEYSQYQFVPAGLATQIDLIVKANDDPANLAASIRRAVGSADPDQPVSQMMTMKEQLADALVAERFGAVSMGSLAVLGLTLAALGLYGVMAYSVSQRTGEFGLRMALGARPGEIFKLVTVAGVRLIVAGLGLGLAGALAVTRFLSGTLYGVSPTDPATFTVISFALAVVALAACYLPARRATKVDPMIALRSE